MTTENTIPLVRDINILMMLDTYQDMSDEEIELVIDFKIKRAIEDHETSENAKAIHESCAKMIEDNYESLQSSHDLLEKIRNRKLNLLEV